MVLESTALIDSNLRSYRRSGCTVLSGLLSISAEAKPALYATRQKMDSPGMMRWVEAGWVVCANSARALHIHAIAGTMDFSAPQDHVV